MKRFLVGVLVAFMNLSVQAAVGDGLVLYLAFDSVSEGVTEDSSGQGSHGQVVGADHTSDGFEGGCFRFDGVDDEIVVTNCESLNPTEAISISVWVRSEGPGTLNGLVLSKGPSTRENTAQYALIHFPSLEAGSGVAAFSLRTTHTAWTDYSSSTILSTGVWYHLVGTYSSGEVRLYVNGVLSSVRTGVEGAIPVMDGDLFIGAGHTFPSDEYFKGCIDEVHIFNRVLSEAEIQELAHLSPSSNSPPQAVLVATPAYGQPPLQVELDFTGSTDVDGDLILFEIDSLNDGVYEYRTNVPGVFSVEYPDAGSFVASLRVTDGTGLSSTARVPVAVSSSPQGLWMQVANGPHEGSVSPDQSGNGNDGHISGAVYGSNIFCEGAYLFDGQDDEIVVSNHPSLNPTNNFSVSAWMNCAGTGTNNGMILIKGPSNRACDAQYALVYFPNNLQGVQGRVSFSMHTTGNNRWRDYYSTTTLSTGVWHHIAGTYTDGELRLYLDGQLSISAPVHGSVVASDGNLLIGADHSFPDDEFFNGMISDVRLYDRVLSASEIAEIYGECGAPLPPVASLTATPTFGEPPLAVDFAFSARHSEEVPILLYELDWNGDGVYDFSTNTSGTASFLFSSSGVYVASLRVTDVLGGVDTETAKIIVGAISNDLVLHFDFDSDGGGWVQDQSVMANNGYVDGATYSENGHCGGAYWFDGVDDAIIVSNSPSLNITNEITISAWMRCFNSGNYNGIVLLKGAPPLGMSAQYALVYFPDNLQGVQGKAAFAIKTTSTGVWSDFYSQGTLDLNTWHHLAGSYKSGELKLYVDGVLSRVETGVTGIIPVEDGDLYIGAENSFHQEHFKGLLDDVRIYNRSLSEAEIQYLYSNCNNEGPVAMLSASPSEGVAPLAVTLDFTGSHDPDGNLVLCELDQEGDGSFEFQTPTPGQVVATYNQPGTYYPQVRVCDSQAQKSSAVASVTVLADTEPVAVLMISPSSGTPPFEATFVATNSFAVQGRGIVLYELDVDGDHVFDLMSYSGVATYTYREPGTFYPILRVTDEKGLQSTTSGVISVESVPMIGSVSLQVEPSCGVVPMEVLFVANVSSPVPIVTYRWDVDHDGVEEAVTTTNTFQFTYTTAGAYEATVVVVDEQGTSVSADTRVLVSEPLNCKVWISDPKEESVLWGDKISIIGHVAPANKATALQFEFKKEGDADWVSLGEPIYPHPNSYKENWDVTLLSDGANYELRAIALLESMQLATSSTYKVSIRSSGEKQPGWVVETEMDGVRLQDTTFGSDQSASMEVSDGTTVFLPAEAVAADATLQIAVQGSDTNPASGAAVGLCNIQQNRKISLDTNPELQKALRIRIPYQDIDNDGIVDEIGIPEETLSIQYFDPESDQWKKTLSSVVHKDENFVETSIYHLTEFGVFGNANLLQSRMGGQLLAFTSESSSLVGKAENLTDGNPVSFWKSSSTSLPQSFLYGFSNSQGAVITQAILSNYGEVENGVTNFSKGFRILSSLDGQTYQVVAEGTLPDNYQAQVVNFPATPCRLIKLELVSGYLPTTMELSEFAVLGTLTNDIDADGITDKWEMDQFGTFARTGSGDEDGDGLSDVLEFQYGGNPWVKDTDGDGMEDGEEFIAGTSIGDARSHFSISSVGLSVQGTTGQAAIRWISVAGKHYKIQCSTNLCGSWPTSTLYEVVGDGSEKSFTNNLPEVPVQLYRISVE